MQASDSSRKPVKVEFRIRNTPAHRTLLQKGAPGHEAKRMGVGLVRVDFSSQLPLPRLMRGVNLPTNGIIREGLDAFAVGPDGEPVRGDREIRDAQGMANAADIVNATAKREHLNPLAWTGLGNVSQNIGCIAWTPHELVYCVPEGERLASRAYRCLNIWNDRRVSINDDRFVPSGFEGRWNPVIEGHNQRERLHLAVSGQPLVLGGNPINPYQDLEAAKGFADIRHLVVSPFPHLTDPATGGPAYDPDGKPIRRDFGLDQVLKDRDLREAAIAGRIVPLGFDMTDVDEQRYTVTAEELERALIEKGYTAASTQQELCDHERAGERGFYRLDRGARQLCILFARSPYPHHFFGVRRDEPHVLYEGVVAGWSNNAGTDPYTLAEDLVRSGFTEAILLDNGGDVVLVHRGSDTTEGWANPNGPRALIPSCLRREQWAALLLYHAGDGSDGAALAISVSREGSACGPYLEFRVEL